MTIKVGVFGAGGRMGATTCAAVAADPELSLVAAVDPHHAGETIGGLAVVGEPRALADAGVDVAIDFTEASAARTNLEWCAAHQVHAVVGTTGLSDDDVAVLAQLFRSSGCAVVPNFAIGAVLLMRFAALAAPWFSTAEIVELHHDAKVDAPSGTALATARAMAAASEDWRADPTTSTVLEGARGGVGPGGIRVHSVRLQGLVAHQEVLLGGPGETLTIRHDSLDRASFMPGVMLAVKAMEGRVGVVVGLDVLLGM